MTTDLELKFALSLINLTYSINIKLNIAKSLINTFFNFDIKQNIAQFLKNSQSIAKLILFFLKSIEKSMSSKQNIIKNNNLNKIA